MDLVKDSRKIKVAELRGCLVELDGLFHFVWLHHTVASREGNCWKKGSASPQNIAMIGRVGAEDEFAQDSRKIKIAKNKCGSPECQRFQEMMGRLILLTPKWHSMLQRQRAKGSTAL